MNGIIKYHEGLTADQRPAVIEDLKDGKGGFNYNFNIVESEVNPAPEEEEAHVRFTYDSITMDAPRTQNHIIECLLAERYPASVEQKLINDYNAAKEKVLPTSAKDGYLAFLADRKVIKEMVEADCSTLGIPNTI